MGCFHTSHSGFFLSLAVIIWDFINIAKSKIFLTCNSSDDILKMRIMVIIHNKYVFACKNVGKTQKKAAIPMVVLFIRVLNIC